VSQAFYQGGVIRGIPTGLSISVPKYSIAKHLRRLDEFVTWREKIAGLYTEALRGVPGVMLVLPAGRSSWYKYIVLLPKGVDREKLKASMKEQGVSLSGGVYDIPLHKQPVFANTISGSFPMADDICSRHVCLPIYYGMTDEEAQYVVDALKKCLS